MTGSSPTFEDRCIGCLLENDPSVIEPDVLSKDRVKFGASGDHKYIDKAHRRQGPPARQGRLERRPGHGGRAPLSPPAHGAGVDGRRSGGSEGRAAAWERGSQGEGGKGSEWIWGRVVVVVSGGRAKAT